MKVWIFYTLFPEPLPPQIWNNYLAQIPASMQEKASRFLRWQDAHAFVLGKLLVLHGLKKTGFEFLTLDELKYNEYDRPFFDSPFDFNLSHSGEMVACAFSTEGQLGLDLEEIKPIDFDDFGQFFSPEELHSMQNSANPTDSFYQLWTLKESVMKADGRGMSLAPKEINVRQKAAFLPDQKWFLEPLDLKKGYSGHLALEKKPGNLEIEFINPLDL